MNLDKKLADKMWEREGCQYIGPDQDPIRNHPIKMCGCRVRPGTPYCDEHYSIVYVAKDRKPKRKLKLKGTSTQEIESLFNEAVAELESEGVL